MRLGMANVARVDHPFLLERQAGKSIARPFPPPELFALPGLAPQTDLDRKAAALLGILRRHHRIVRRQAPFGTIFVRGDAIVRHKMALEHLELLAVIKAHDIVRLD